MNPTRTLPVALVTRVPKLCNSCRCQDYFDLRRWGVVLDSASTNKSTYKHNYEYLGYARPKQSMLTWSS